MAGKAHQYTVLYLVLLMSRTIESGRPLERL